MSEGEQHAELAAMVTQSSTPMCLQQGVLQRLRSTAMTLVQEHYSRSAHKGV